MIINYFHHLFFRNKFNLSIIILTGLWYVAPSHGSKRRPKDANTGLKDQETGEDHGLILWTEIDNEVRCAM